MLDRDRNLVFGSRSRTSPFRFGFGAETDFRPASFESLQNPRAAVNAVLGFSRWFGRVLGLRVAGPGARKRTAIRPDDAMRFLLMHKFRKGVFRPWNNSTEKNENFTVWLTFAGRHLAVGTFAIPGLQDFNFSNLPSTKKVRNRAEERFLSSAHEEARSTQGKGSRREGVSPRIYILTLADQQGI